VPRKNGKALKALYFSCLNFEKGCDQLIAYTKVESHDKECKKNLAQCKICLAEI